MSRDLDRIRPSVVKIYTQSDAPDYEQPWQTKGVISAVGSGVVVQTQRGRRVLTNAHVVEDQVFVEVRRFGQPRKYVAEVEGVGHECDLAIIAVPNRKFFASATPLEIGDLPRLGDQVTVLGYPIGGDRLSLTQGVASRIEMSPYAQSQRRLLAIQIDAAINAGNSGGPVVNKKGEMVGVAFQALDEAENIGYMIGAPVVRHFLRDMEDRIFDGFPDLGVTTQRLGSAAHRRSIGLPPRLHGGVLVTEVVYRGSAWRCLNRGDVLMKIGSTAVAADGSVKFRDGERIHFSFLVARRRVGDEMRVTFWRDGEVQRCGIELKPPSYLVPEERYDVRPTYYLSGGLLFVPLTRDYLKTWGSEWWTSAPSNLVAIYEGEVRTASRQEVVLVQKVMADRVNQGYHELESQVVTRVQRKKIRSLRDLIRIVGAARGEFLRFDLDDGRAIVLDRKVATERQPEILRRFGIPRDRSQDLIDGP